MTRFYRFISSDELHAILTNSFTNDMIASEDAAMVHLFKEETPTIIADHKHHYALDMTDFFTGGFDKETLTKETAMKTLRGVVSEDYLIALEFDKEPTIYNLGWYGHDENNHQVVLENGISYYQPSDVKAIYRGDFYNWKDIVEIPFERLAIKEPSKKDLDTMAKHYNYDLDETLENYKGLYLESDIIGLASHGDADTIDKKGILLSDVLIRPHYRHFGFGTAFITQLCNQFIEDDIYVDLLDPRLEAFYEPIDFVPSDIDEVFVRPATGLLF
jgi:hypothetical protein